MVETGLTLHQNPDLLTSPASPLSFLSLSSALLLPDNGPLLNPPIHFSSDYTICLFPSFGHRGLLWGPSWFWSQVSRLSLT